MQSNNSSALHSKSFLVVLVLISMGGPLGMNIVLPSLPAYQVAFDTDYAFAQLTLTLYLAAVAVGQLIYGPLSDQFGRRPVVLTGLSILLVGSILCVFAETIEMLIFGRMVQAIGGCAGMVMGRAMVRDRYGADAAASIIAYLTMAIVLAPSLAPLIGGVLEDTFSWQASFIFMTFFAIMLLGVALKGADETLFTTQRQKTHFGMMFLSFWFLLKNAGFRRYALMVAFCTGAYFSFLGGAPYVIVDLMGGTATEVGLAFVIISAFYVLGNFITARMVKKLGVPQVVLTGTIIIVLAAVLLFAVEFTIGLSIFSLFGLMSLMAFGNGFCISSGLAGALGADPERVGAASGLAGSLQIGFGSISTFVVGSSLAYFEGSTVPLLVVIGINCVLGFLVFSSYGFTFRKNPLS